MSRALSLFAWVFIYASILLLETGICSSLEEDFKQNLSKNLVTLAEDFNATKIPRNACKGCRLSVERVHIALASLLMEQTACSAVFTTPKGKLWIGCNEFKKQQIDSLMQSIGNLLQKENIDIAHREGLIEDSDVRKILGLSSNKGRFRNSEQKKIREAITKSADEMVHWLKKILSLRNHIDGDSDLASLARNLRDGKIKYLTTTDNHHAEMNILDKLYKYRNGSLFEMGGFIAISKTCCLKCAAALQAVNMRNRNRGGGLYQANGCHFKLYDWPIPEFMEDNPRILKKFLGPKAYEIYVQSERDQEYFFKLIRNLRESDKKTKRNTKQEATKTLSLNTLAYTERESAYSIKNGKHEVNIKVKRR